VLEHKNEDQHQYDKYADRQPGENAKQPAARHAYAINHITAPSVPEVPNESTGDLYHVSGKIARAA